MTDPVRHSIFIACAPSHAFTVFVERIDDWWPPSHRRPGARMRLEGEAGGRLVQVLPDGTELEWGEVVVYEPPERLAYTWVPGSTTGRTLVEVRFVAEQDGTRVHVVHRVGESEPDDWTQRAARFESAWESVLPAFARHCAATPD